MARYVDDQGRSMTSSEYHEYKDFVRANPNSASMIERVKQGGAVTTNALVNAPIERLHLDVERVCELAR